jgi:hypothetical protein
MDILEDKLNYDVVDYIKQHTIQEIKNDAKILLDEFTKLNQFPIEPVSGKQYSTWLSFMLYHTKNIKPLEDEFKNVYKAISESKDFDTSQSLYPKLKDIFDEWYDIKQRHQFSGSNYGYE